jgi:hypothetical protein
MSESDSFWDFYWEVRLEPLQNLGKREAILAVSRLVRQLERERPGQPVRLVELGCGEGQVIGPLAAAHGQLRDCAGVDYAPQAIEQCRRDYPAVRFYTGDFTDPALLESLGQFDIVLMVNALHEVFSDALTDETAPASEDEARRRVERALAGAVGLLAPSGFFALFDGLEPPGDLHRQIRVRFRHLQARQHFDTFATEYRPFHIQYTPTADPLRVELSLRDFTRYITKSIFLGKRLWQSERFESYQYFTEADFRAAFARQGLAIRALRTLTVDYENWRALVEIETPGVDFPEEHIWILAQKVEGGTTDDKDTDPLSG